MSCRCRSPFATRKMFLIFWASACRPIAVSYWCLLNNVAYLDRDWCVTHINVCCLIRTSLLTSSITKFRFSSYFIDIRWNTIRKHYFERTNSPKTTNLMEQKLCMRLSRNISSLIKFYSSVLCISNFFISFELFGSYFCSKIFSHKLSGARKYSINFSRVEYVHSFEKSFIILVRVNIFIIVVSNRISKYFYEVLRMNINSLSISLKS